MYLLDGDDVGKEDLEVCGPAEARFQLISVLGEMGDGRVYEVPVGVEALEEVPKKSRLRRS